MTLITSLILAAILGGGYWLDSDISSIPGRFWWGGLVAAYLLLGLSRRYWRHPLALPLIAGAGLVMLGAGWFYDDMMTAYVSGAVMLFIVVVVRHLCGWSNNRRLPLAITGLVALSLVLLPVSVNRITVKLPNLSGGSYLTIATSPNQAPRTDARFFNRLDYHQELHAGLGTQIWFGQEHDPPLLRIDILREKIVIRIISIIYETRVAYLDLPLFTLEEKDLLRLTDSGLGQPFRHQMENDVLLIDNLIVDRPAWIQLPHMEDHDLPLVSRLAVILARLLIWSMIAFAILRWVPSRLEAES